MIKLDKEKVDKLFETCTHQEDVAVELYRIVYPNWDNIKSIDGYPYINKETGSYLMKKFIEFDQLHHPTVINGGLWLNKGFSSHGEKQLDDWMIDPAPVVTE